MLLLIHDKNNTDLLRGYSVITKTGRIAHTEFSFSEYIKRYNLRNWTVMTSEKFSKIADRVRTERYKTLTKITEEEFWYALEILPPENWQRSGPFEHFRMMEYLTGSWTAQYAQYKNQCLTKIINVFDESTWIKLSDFA